MGSQGEHGVYWSLHGIFPETFKLLNIILVLPVGTASVERSFTSMLVIKILGHPVRISIEGLELAAVDFHEVLNVFKEKNCRIQFRIQF